MPKIPSLDYLQFWYPSGTPAAVAKLVGGRVEQNYNDRNFNSYKDTCTIRISYALNYGGDPIPDVSNIANPYVGGHVRTNKGGDGKRYIFSTRDMRAYFYARYGHGTKFSGSATEADLSGVRGIIAFGFYHVDLWDGFSCYHQCYFRQPEVMNDKIIVWETELS